MSSKSCQLRNLALGGAMLSALSSCGGVDSDWEGTETSQRTDALEGRRYDNLPDVGEFVVDGRAWTNTNLTYFFQNGTGDIAGSGEEAAFRDAISLWEEQTPLAFTEVASAAAADIVVQFSAGDHGDAFPFDGAGGTLAHAFYPPPNGGSLAGDAHFDEDETWSTAVQGSSGSPIDLVTVAAHELGHSLGLAHSSETGALMNAFYTGSQRFLSVDDIAGIQQVYGFNTAPEANDHYGEALAMGDFNGDGYEDFAIGVPGQTVSGNSSAGAVYVHYATEDGPIALQILTQDSYGIEGGAESGDRFGSALASGDFDNDGRDDLAIGAPGESIGAILGAGAINVVFGSTSGLAYVDNQVFYQGSSSIQGAAEPNDEFGSSIAVGDFDGDGYDDVVVGAPGEGIGNASAAGALHVLPGSSTGLDAGRDALVFQGSSGIVGTSEAGDQFAASLATGDFDGDGYDDIIAGIPGKTVGSDSNAGAVHIVYGASSGVTTSGDLQLHQDSPGIAGGAEPSDLFGSSVASTDVNGDGYDDLMIGSPGEAVGSITAAGAINVIFGSSGGPTSSGDYTLDQNSSGVAGGAEAGDAFGFSLAPGDFDNDGYGDIAVGVPGEGIGSLTAAGCVQVFMGSAAGPSGADDKMFHQDSSGVEGAAEAGDRFGQAVTVGDFNGDGRDELGIGAPDEDVEGASNAGAAHMLVGSASGVTANGSLLFFE